MEATYDEMEKSDSAMAREKVLDDIKTLMVDSEELLKATAGDMSETVKAARARMTEALGRAKSSYIELQGGALASATAAAKKADVVIRDHPYESIGIAFGVGLLIGALAGRR